MSVTFNVKVGPKIKVGDIKFVGDKGVNSRTPAGVMKNLRPLAFLSLYLPGSIFHQNV